MSAIPTSDKAADQLPAATQAASDSASISYYNQALQYAATTASKTFGTSFLVYANKSSVFRGLMNSSAIWAKFSFWGSLVANEGIALANEWKSMQAGECQ
jgi:hypothetical protein